MNNQYYNKIIIFVAAIFQIAFFSFFCSSNVRYAARSERQSSQSDTEKPVLKSSIESGFYEGQVITGVSSYYGSQFNGRLTANGEVFDMYKSSAAHRFLPFNTLVRVTNLSNNKSVIVHINDRGPFVGDRILDLSYGAAKKIDMIDDGVANIKMEIIRLGN